MASPAEVANDMTAHAKYWQKRDNRIFAACHDSARLIRMHSDGKEIDGRTWGGLHRRLLDLTSNSTAIRLQGTPNFDRALQTLYALRSKASQ